MSATLTALAGVVAMASACSSTTARFTGREHPSVASADELVVYGADQPEGHEVIGVVSVRCGTTNGTSGLLAVPCTTEQMGALLRERAADVGGTGLFELRCDDADVERTIDDVDGGTVQQSTRAGLTCHATVVRRTAGVRVGAGTVRRQPAKGPSKGRRVTVAGVEVEIGADPSAPKGPVRTDVGEMDRFPEGYADLGRAWAKCVTGCARSVARRALVSEAGRHGAYAIAALGCELVAEAWHCEARMVGGALPDDAGASPDAATAGMGGSGGAQSGAEPIGHGGAESTVAPGGGPASQPLR